MQIVSLEDILHELSKPIVWEYKTKEFNLSSAEFTHRVVNFKSSTYVKEGGVYSMVENLFLLEWLSSKIRCNVHEFKVIAFSGVSIRIMLDAGAQALRRPDTLVFYYIIYSFTYLIIYLLLYFICHVSFTKETP